jgi:hypothetical protein
VAAAPEGSEVYVVFEQHGDGKSDVHIHSTFSGAVRRMLLAAGSTPGPRRPGAVAALSATSEESVRDSGIMVVKLDDGRTLSFGSDIVLE